MKPHLPVRQAAIAAGIALSLSCSAAFAADASQRVVVTAARAPQTPDQLVADVVVIDAEQIARAGPVGLAELLQRHAGAELSATGGPGQVSGVFLRGTNTNHVVLLIDGVRVNSATTGTNALEHIPLQQIERIEVLRGPASSLYGADAIGGVIQVFTRTVNGITAKASAGSDRLRELNAGVGRVNGDTSWSLHAGALDVKAFSATNERNLFSFNPDDDPYRNASLNARVLHQWAQGHRITLRGLATRAATHFDAGAVSDDINRQRLSSLALESDDRLSETWRSQLRLARGSDHSRSEGAFPSTFDTDQDQLTWQNDLKFGAADLIAGAEWRRERVTSDTAYTQTSRRVASAFGGMRWSADALQLEGSLRTDRNSQFGTHTTGRIGAGYALTPHWRLTAAAGTAFHAPSFNDLYFPLTFGFSGNPELKPERSRGVDAALRYSSDGTTLSIGAFHNRITDLIAVDPTFSTVINVNRARIRGTTLAAGHRSGIWRADFEWTHQDPRDAATGNLLVRRARNHGRVGASVDIGPVRAGADLHASDARFDSAANLAATRMGGYGVLTLHAHYAVTPEFGIGARILNATDKRHEIAQGYNTAPRQYVVSVDMALP
ncbi:MAG: TonB-dependent receptor [Burkholderiaceae bacterium]|nr:TonB-dependent receptor [Burkholderiaceae bacterium]